MRLRLIKPTVEELDFRQELLSDEATMSYNKAYGGTIPFPRERWSQWHSKWISSEDSRYFYRYLFSVEEARLVGEVAYHQDNIGRWLCDVLIHADARGRGYGGEGLELLCNAAAENGIFELYDVIAADNPSVGLFLRHGFSAVSRDEAAVTVKRTLEIKKDCLP